MLIKTRFVPSVGLLLSILAPPVIVLLPTSTPRLAVTLALVCFLPGWALVEGLYALSGERPGPGERLLLGLGAGYVVTVVGGLWLYYALGRLTPFSLLALYTAISLAGFGLALARSRGAEERRGGGETSPTPLLPCSPAPLLTLGFLAFAAYFRFYFLSYSDFRGDEAEVVLRAVAIIRGDGQPILAHTKGPAETLLVAAFGLLYGAFDELMARLPFALGNWLAVVGVYVLGERLWGRRVAFIGGVLVVINGWLVAHSRLAQYQSLVLLLSILAVWCYVRFYQEGGQVYHLLGTLFLATAILSHYEGTAATPAVLYLLILSLKQQGDWSQPIWRNIQRMWPLVLSLAVGMVIILSFYVPFILNPAIAGAQSNVAKRFGGSSPYNNWDVFYINSLSFNSIYYTLGVGIMLLGGTLHGVRRAMGNGRWSAIAALGALPLLLLSWTSLLPPWYALLVYLGLMGLFLFSPRASVPVKTMLLWILLPAGLYLFAVVRPGNHFYVFMPPLMLLAALTLDRGLCWLEQWRRPLRRWIVPAVVGGLLALYGLSAWYEYLVFMRTDLEYMLTYPRQRNPAFWSDPRYPFDIRIGWGYPYRLGWQTVSELYRSGQLAGDWYGSDENNSIFLYTLGWPRNPCYPRYFMLTEIGYSEPPLEVTLETIERYYTLRATVQVNGQPRLRLYEFAPLGDNTQPAVYDEPARYPTPYRQEMLKGSPLTGPAFQPSIPLTPPRHFKPPPDVLARLADVYGDPRIVQVRDEVSLLGYDVDDTWAAPGGVLLLTLYWRADGSVILPYKIFTHLEDTQLWAQADDEPGCGQFPTYRWRAGDQVMDRHAIFLPADVPSGQYPLQVGLYEIRTGLRMDLLDDLGNPAGNTLLLPSVTIRPAD